MDLNIYFLHIDLPEFDTSHKPIFLNPGPALADVQTKKEEKNPLYIYIYIYIYIP